MHRRMERRCFQGSVRLPEASSSSAQRRARLSPPSLNPLHIGSCEQPQVKHCSRRAPTTSRNCQRARTQTALHQQEGHRHARPPAAAAWHPNQRRKHTRSIALHSRLTTRRGLAASAAGLHTLTGASPHTSLATTPICFSDCCQKEEQGRPAPCTPHSRSAARTPNHHKRSNLKVTQAWPQTSKPPAPSSNDVLHWISHC